MTTYRADPKWLDWWTIFYWGWFIGYAPMMGLYVAKVSRAAAYARSSARCPSSRRW